MTLPAQPGILQPVPIAGRHLFFTLSPLIQPAQARTTLAAFAPLVDGDTAIAGLGSQLVQSLQQTVPGLREFPALTVAGSGVPIPSSQAALWVWLRGTDRGDFVQTTRRMENALAPAFTLETVTDVFRYGTGRDLTGYEDGTANPVGDDAIAAALVQGIGQGFDGSSFAAVQQWLHDFNAFENLSPAARDDAIGRRLRDNEEFESAPASAHVKRTAQENFEPEAFVLRRSMPWAHDKQAGLLFLAFGKSLDAFEAQLRRMAGLDDGVVDALFGFSRPVTGSYFWCPPMRAGKLDLSTLGL
ncbi:MAG: Dyp-type peroxidase [Burkholderiales bacterium]|jgi:putative iron-dependent peroxidase|nr:Dyp-type peroxidase [Burkholderiales bacterium]